ncbi:hypothetical protein BDP81DRAFT_393884 [Colletotrichum phormii]|uniref:Uncharacterized protein n=1 Tax=Colletotrichum phormii TaxID=359342 RepID=A0AAI9ZS70_9PEZI|nr:uncharacterized protein BDP81DRAFT_393884 [Colletotrichum phormii]KAK1637201.1 hypothetical protein BDP81DRAFT_393884 [Colletotrichum phormii]
MIPTNTEASWHRGSLGFILTSFFLYLTEPGVRGTCDPSFLERFLRLNINQTMTQTAMATTATPPTTPPTMAPVEFEEEPDGGDVAVAVSEGSTLLVASGSSDSVPITMILCPL